MLNIECKKQLQLFFPQKKLIIINNVFVPQIDAIEKLKKNTKKQAESPVRSVHM